MKKGFLLCLTVFLLIGALSFSVLAAVVGFSGDMKMTDAKGKVATGKIFSTGDKIRQEIVTDKTTAITIMRFDKKVTWTLLEDNKYMEIKLPFDPAHPPTDPEFEYEEVNLGTETVNGYTCKVTQYKYKNTKYGTATIWVSDKLGFALKTESKDSKGKLLGGQEYSNIKVGKQDPALFEIPEGYEKFSLPFKLPGM